MINPYCCRGNGAARALGAVLASPPHNPGNKLLPLAQDRCGSRKIPTWCSIKSIPALPCSAPSGWVWWEETELGPLKWWFKLKFEILLSFECSAPPLFYFYYCNFSVCESSLTAQPQKSWKVREEKEQDLNFLCGQSSGFISPWDNPDFQSLGSDPITRSWCHPLFCLGNPGLMWGYPGDP